MNLIIKLKNKELIIPSVEQSNNPKSGNGSISGSGVTKLATVDIEKFESSQAFISFALDEGRLEQGYNWLAENGKPQDEKGTGDFIRWIVNDVAKECKLEMEENKIQEKELGKLLANPAKRWYFTRLNKYEN